jgi:methionyl-tRNA synthetase
VPNDSTQTIYVWLDALVNYLTVAGYPNEASFRSVWPPDCQVVGKDILRFHAIYWPAFLMALGLELPKQLLCHGHWMMENRKMSKSLGNVVDPFECISKYTSDGVRYFLLREGVPDTDCNLSVDKFSKYTNSELANTLGNLFQRCLSFNKAFLYPAYCEIEASLDKSERAFLDELDRVREECNENYEAFHFYKGIQLVMSKLRHSNNIVQECKPWELVKKEQEEGDDSRMRINKMLFLVYESLRISGILLQPVTPNISRDLLDRLNVPNERRTYEFARVEYKKANSTQLVSKPGLIFKRL